MASGCVTLERRLPFDEDKVLHAIDQYWAIIKVFDTDAWRGCDARLTINRHGCAN
jgi:hypothetical protein